MPEPERVLIIEDDQDIADVVSLNLGDLGLAPTGPWTARTGLRERWPATMRWSSWT